MREPIHESVGTYTESTSEITSKTTAQTTAGTAAPALTLVQGGNSEDVVVADSKFSDQIEEIQDMLMMEGITQDVAISLSERFSADQIKRQIAWMPRRTATGSRPGYLRRAIEQDYSAPAGVSSTGASPKAVESPRVAQMEEVRAIPSCQRLYVPSVAPEQPVVNLEETQAQIATYSADVQESARRHVKETNKFEWKREQLTLRIEFCLAPPKMGEIGYNHQRSETERCESSRKRPCASSGRSTPMRRGR